MTEPRAQHRLAAILAAPRIRHGATNRARMRVENGRPLPRPRTSALRRIDCNGSIAPSNGRFRRRLRASHEVRRTQGKALGEREALSTEYQALWTMSVGDVVTTQQSRTAFADDTHRPQADGP